ncbi:MAG: acyl-CoA reductase [Bacteroidetes bacterium]|nr:acyl-CoA reductase [Bacteroidota bacterium]
MENQILGLCELGKFIYVFFNKDEQNYNEIETEFHNLLQKSKIENSWFTVENQKFALLHWANIMNKGALKQWTDCYHVANKPKRIGLILAGNIPLVGLHDVVSVILSGHIPVIKLSSKDRLVLPFLLNLWNKFSGDSIQYEIVEKLENYDAVIATGSNNTARYLEYYFKEKPNIIRKNRTSIAVLSGAESETELQNLAEDIFRYYGLGCRNVTRLFVPKDFLLDRLFESFISFKEISNHHQYNNNYEYNRAIYLLNQEKFWDNNFVLLKEDDALFSPLAVINFSRYESLEEVKDFINENSENIQCVVANENLKMNALHFGEAQFPSWDTYADNVDTMAFLGGL